jgi:hypothetical protein
MTSKPPEDCICGEWGVDLDQTRWKVATDLPRDGKWSIHNGRLLIMPDGSFRIEKLPNFWDMVSFAQSATGKWNIAEMPDGYWYIGLRFLTIGGRAAESGEYVSFFFRHEGEEYFLHHWVSDPDSGDILVMKRKGPPPQTDTVPKS